LSADEYAIPDAVFHRALTFVRSVGGHVISRYSVGSHGYAQIGWQQERRTVTVLCHRLVWIARYNVIPDDMTVDHRCKVRRCINLDHLRLIPNLENARRTAGRDWPLGECVNGHPDVLYWHQPASGGKGYCRECRRILQFNKRRSAREQVLTSLSSASCGPH